MCQPYTWSQWCFAGLGLCSAQLTTHMPVSQSIIWCPTQSACSYQCLRRVQSCRQLHRLCYNAASLTSGLLGACQGAPAKPRAALTAQQQAGSAADIGLADVMGKHAKHLRHPFKCWLCLDRSCKATKALIPEGFPDACRGVPAEPRVALAAQQRAGSVAGRGDSHAAPPAPMHDNMLLKAMHIHLCEFEVKAASAAGCGANMPPLSHLCIK